MSEIRRDSGGFIGYEYKELSANGRRASFYLDCYHCFGWQPDERMGGAGAKGRLVLKRARKLTNRTELTRLQRHFEACVEEISALERSKTAAASAAALITGVIGTACMAGSVFAVTHTPPLVVWSILLAVPGFIGWILPIFLYRNLTAKRCKVVAELLDQKYDEICQLCEQGNKLLN